MLPTPSRAGVARLFLFSFRATRANAQTAAMPPSNAARAQHVAVWRMLRKPFARTPGACGAFRGCVWETIDFGLVACTRCGRVHDCDHDVCDDVESTDDGVVCRITGMVVRSINYAAHEHSDSVCVFTRDAESLTTIFQAHLARIPAVVASVLSPTARPQMHYLHVQRNVHRLVVSVLGALNAAQASAQASAQAAAQPRAPLDVIALLARAAAAGPVQQNLHYVAARIDTPRLIDRCSTLIYEFLVRCRNDALLNTRPSELQSTVVGLLYLLRVGVRYDTIEVLKSVPALAAVLPPANILERSTGTRAKVITEVENRVKFRLRDMTRDAVMRTWA